MWQWTVHRKPIPLDDLGVYQLYYLSVCPTPADPTIVWGTEVRMEALEAYLRRRNATGNMLLSPAHFLIKNVAKTMERHREFNCRVARRLVFEYKQTNLIVPLFNQGGGEVNTLLLEDVPALSLEQIAEFMWKQTSAAAQGEFSELNQPTLLERLPRWFCRLGMWFHIWNHNTLNFPRMKMLKKENVASMMVNYYGSRNTPPLRSYKPSRFPLDGIPFNITMGPTRDQPVVERGQVVPGRVAPLFLRGDHRVVDAYQMKNFLETLNRGFEHPEEIEAIDAASRQAA